MGLSIEINKDYIAQRKWSIEEILDKGVGLFKSTLYGSSIYIYKQREDSKFIYIEKNTDGLCFLSGDFAVNAFSGWKFVKSNDILKLEISN